MKRLISLAVESKVYPKTTVEQWIGYFMFCIKYYAVFTYEYEGKLVGFFSWHKTNTKEEAAPMEINGKYLIANIFYIKKEYREHFNVRKIIKNNFEFVKKYGFLTEVEEIIWKRPDNLKKPIEWLTYKGGKCEQDKTLQV